MLLALLMSYELVCGEASKDQTPASRKAPEGSPLGRIGGSEIASRGTGPPPMNPKLGSSNPSPLVPSSSAMGGERKGALGGNGGCKDRGKLSDQLMQRQPARQTENGQNQRPGEKASGSNEMSLDCWERIVRSTSEVD